MYSASAAFKTRKTSSRLHSRQEALQPKTSESMPYKTAKIKLFINTGDNNNLSLSRMFLSIRLLYHFICTIKQHLSIAIHIMSRVCTNY